MIEVDTRIYNEKLNEYKFHSKQHKKIAKKMYRVAKGQSITADLQLRDIGNLLNYHTTSMDELEEWLKEHTSS